jgi:DNA-binding transcriptional ArsR family regulator
MSGDALDPIIHADTRLRIMTTLAALPAGDKVSFGRLRHDLGLTVGNLSTHLTKLEAAGYISIEKTFEGRRPATYAALTAEGRTAFDRYVSQLRELLGPAR